MMCYSVQSRDQIVVKGYGFLSFAKNMGKNISKNFSSKYSQKFLGHGRQSGIDELRTASKIIFQKTAEATGDMIRNKIANKV